MPLAYPDPNRSDGTRFVNAPTSVVEALLTEHGVKAPRWNDAPLLRELLDVLRDVPGAGLSGHVESSPVWEVVVDTALVPWPPAIDTLVRLLRFSPDKTWAADDDLLGVWWD